MKTIEDILNGFDDYEIAVFCKHKLAEYMTGTQNKVEDYVKNSRGLNEFQIEKLVDEKPEIKKTDKSIHCPNCKSKKLIKTRVKWVIPAFRVGYEDEMASWKELRTGQATYKDKIECFVCGHILFDPNNEKRSFYKKLLDIFFDQALPI
jgi:DNA-directed RNA polymerase subunit RPC12/RpoP